MAAETVNTNPMTPPIQSVFSPDNMSKKPPVMSQQIQTNTTHKPMTVQTVSTKKK